MKKFFLMLAAGMLGLVCNAQQLKPVAKKINDLKSARATFTEVKLFDLSTQSRERGKDLSETVSDATVMEFREHDAQAIVSQHPENIRLSIPFETGSIELELYRSSVFTPDFSVVTSSSNGQPVPYTGGLHYWGIMPGDNSSIAAISIFNGEVMGMISSPSLGNFVLGKLEKDPSGMHILYNDRNLHGLPPSGCSTPEDGLSYSPEDLQLQSRAAMINCIRIYWEVNEDIFIDKGSISNATNYVVGLFNESALLYANDGIPVELSQVFVWDTTSPYTGSSSSSLLHQFQAYRNSFNGDLGGLLGYAGGGGIAAGFSGFCAFNLDDSQCYSGIHSSFNSVPVFSWSVEVVTHEQGHLMGSRHTHACVWNGNSTAIDGCGPSAGYPYEGSCSGAPVPAAGGTIMSYCHLSTVGINFSIGFGPQPATVIWNNYSNAACLSTCSGGTFCGTTSNMSTSAVTNTTATFNWAAVTGAVNYIVKYRIVGTTGWQTDSSLTTSYNAVSLTPGSNYEWQVQTVCAGGGSLFTSSAFFITIPLTCNPPSGVATINITSLTAVFTWSPAQAAIGYNIQYRIVGSATWITGTTISNSYHATGLIPNSNYEWQVQTICAGGGTSGFSASTLFTTLEAGAPVIIVMQPDAECGKDAEIGSCVSCGNNVVNFGDSPELDATAWTVSGASANLRSLLQFDLTAIPPGSAVQSAFLSLYWNPASSNPGHSTMNGPNDGTISEIILPWDEHTVTWVNQPGATSQNQVIIPASTSATQDYLNLDVTAMMQDFVNDPDHNYGMMVQLATEVHYRSLIFCSSDNSNPALRPKLEITYSPNQSNCLSYQYSSCSGVDAVIGSCVSNGSDTSNFGGSPELNAMAWTVSGQDANQRSLLYWDLSAIPPNAIVTSAEVSLYWNPTSSNPGHSTLTGSNDGFLARVTGPWSEDQVTWNTQPLTSAANQAVLPASLSPQQDYTNIDVTAMVQDMITNPSANYGFMIGLATESHYRSLIFASSDNADPAKHPKIDVCYVLPIPTAVKPISGKNNFMVQQDFASHTVTVLSPENFEPDASLVLYNATGQLIRKFENLTGKIFSFNWSDYAGGIYFYHIISKKELQNGKLMFR